MSELELGAGGCWGGRCAGGGPRMGAPLRGGPSVAKGSPAAGAPKPPPAIPPLPLLPVMPEYPPACCCCGAPKPPPITPEYPFPIMPEYHPPACCGGPKPPPIMPETNRLLRWRQHPRRRRRQAERRVGHRGGERVRQRRCAEVGGAQEDAAKGSDDGVEAAAGCQLLPGIPAEAVGAPIMPLGG
eukprot:jgi/Tetstr1/449900/TSEL_036959.t1